MYWSEFLSLDSKDQVDILDEQYKKLKAVAIRGCSNEEMSKIQTNISTMMSLIAVSDKRRIDRLRAKL